MNKETKTIIEGLLSLLSDWQKEQDILELNLISENKEIIKYLNKTGTLEIKYEIINKKFQSVMQETGGVTHLWYKRQDNTWIIKLWDIKRFMK